MMEDGHHQPKARTFEAAIARAERERAMLRLFLAIAEVLEGDGRDTIDDLIELLESTIDDRDD
jgi:hypothetical protein